MSEPNLEQVKRLAEQLSPEERKQLWKHLADLPDSDIQSLDLQPTSTEGAEQKDVVTVDGDSYVLIYTETTVIVILAKRPIFQVTFHPENYRLSQMEIRSWKDALPTERMREQV